MPIRPQRPFEHEATFKELVGYGKNRRFDEVIDKGGSGGVWWGCRPQGCGRQAYRDVFTASPARRHPTRDNRKLRYDDDQRPCQRGFDYALLVSPDDPAKKKAIDDRFATRWNR